MFEKAKLEKVVHSFAFNYIQNLELNKLDIYIIEIIKPKKFSYGDNIFL